MDNKNYAFIQRRNIMWEYGEKVYLWLKEIGERYKASGNFPLFLTDYYSDADDIEIAGLVEMLIPTDYKRVVRVPILREILGDNPSKMLFERDFNEYSMRAEERLFKGSKKFFSDLIILLDRIWYIKHDQQVPLEYAVLSELGLQKANNFRILETIGDTKKEREKLWLLLAKMTLKDGFGKGIWNSTPIEDLHCPELIGVKKLVNSFYFIRGASVKNDDMQDVIRFMGYDSPVEFLYTFWGYRSVRLSNEPSFEHFEKRFKTLYYLYFRPKKCGRMLIRKHSDFHIPDVSLVF